MSTVEKIALTIIVLTIVGIFSVLISNFFNRHIHKIQKIAKDYVRRCLSERARINVDEFIKSIGIPVQSQPKVKIFLNNLAKIIGVDAEYLPTEDKFCDIFRVKKENLGEDDQKVWENAKLHKYLSKRYLNVFSYDIFEALEKNLGKEGIEKVNVKWEKMPNEKKPRNEEEWIEFIWQMSLKEIILFFFEQE